MAHKNLDDSEELHRSYKQKGWDVKEFAISPGDEKQSVLRVNTSKHIRKKMEGGPEEI